MAAVEAPLHTSDLTEPVNDVKPFDDVQMETIGKESFVNLGDDADFNDVNDVRCDGSSGEEPDNGDNNNGILHEDANRDDKDERYRRITELTTDDILGLEFGSEYEACEFYRTYARCHGFVIRKDDVSRDLKGKIVMRQLVCNREGLRKKKHLTRVDRIREHKPITRTKCPAKFRVHLDYKTSKWKVVAFEESHNHELTPTEFVHLIPAYRGMTDADKAQVESLHLYGVRTCHIIGFMLGQKGGYADLGFCKKDLYNHLDKNKRAKIEGGDAFAALSYLQGKVNSDPMLFAKFTTTEDGRHQHLFWSDGASRIDFQCFGDVVAFDSTYKKNKYNQPLVIFSGCNHHGNTTIFGSALVADEKVETYKWVLETFLEAMFNKHPTAVVTDGDGAMREAIKDVFPNASHRLCGWHLQNNACENIKNSKFLEDFKTAIYSNFNEEEFEDYWKKMIQKHGLSKHKWIKKIYETRRMWAHAYMRDKFFAGIRTTSQCEGINSFIKRYVEKKNSLVDFMHNFDQCLRDYRNNEQIADFNSMYSDPVMTTALYKLELEASKIFTRQIFKEVKQEIEDVGALIVIQRSESDNNVKFNMNRYCSPRSEYVVMFDKEECKFLCDCRLFESRGIPCSHTFCSMKHEHMDSIPSSLICKRWTKGAKNDFISSIVAEESDSKKMFMLRFAALTAACNRMCHLAAKNLGDFNHIRDEVFKLTVKLEKRGDPSSNHIGDPTIVRTKGAPSKKKYGRKRRRCSHCRRTGHIIRKCPKLLRSEGETDTLQSISCSESDENTRDLENDDVSLDDNPTMKNNSIQTSNHNENVSVVEVKGVATPKRKHEKVACPTQNSAMECSKFQKDVSQTDPLHTIVKHHNGMDNNLMSYGCLNRGGQEVIMSTSSLAAPPAPPTLTPCYSPFTQGLAIFPQYYGVPVYPQAPQVPIYPHDPSLGLFPEYLGAFQNVNVENLRPRLQQEDQITKKN